MYLIAGVLHPGLGHPIPKTRRVQQDESKSVGKQHIAPQSTLLQNTQYEGSLLDTFCRAKTLLHRRRAKFCTPPSGCICPAQSEGPRWMRGSFELYPQIWVNSLSISSQICHSVYPVGHRQGPHFPNCFGYFFPRADIC